MVSCNIPCASVTAAVVKFVYHLFFESCFFTFWSDSLCENQLAAGDNHNCSKALSDQLFPRQAFKVSFRLPIQTIRCLVWGISELLAVEI